jgi:phage shock protein A
MGPLDPFVRPLRSLLGVTEQAEADIAHHSPLAETHALEAKLEEAVAAVHRAAEATERHVATLESLSDSLPPLTASVTQLTEQIRQLLALAAPLTSAEHEVSRLERLFHRQHSEAEPPAGSAPSS